MIQKHDGGFVTAARIHQTICRALENEASALRKRAKLKSNAGERNKSYRDELRNGAQLCDGLVQSLRLNVSPLTLAQVLRGELG
jgi:hypothetical protein